MRQLPLPISAAAQPGLDNYIAGANAEALERVRALASGQLREAIVYLWGEPGSGRSHLLHAAARANPAMVIADDVDTLDAAAQQALFSAINAARVGGPAVLAAGSAPPAGLGLREDLRTRLGWGLVYQLKPLADAEKALYLRSEAVRRGLRLTDEVLWYLLNHLPRDLASLHAVLDRLDRHSLARQRALTLPLVREALSNNDDD
ncbi:MAG: DnaA- protein [Betaproteobacteria bacterium]|nr:DnaA- protein [Betaproteobacteria bacterium]